MHLQYFLIQKFIISLNSIIFQNAGEPLSIRPDKNNKFYHDAWQELVFF